MDDIKMKMMEWSKNNTLLLINDLKTFPLLWNTKDPYYRIQRRKLEAWKQLAAKYNTTAVEVKRKWLSLQASYRREKWKNIYEKTKSKWFAYNAMRFLYYRPQRTFKVITKLPEHYGNNSGSDNEIDNPTAEDYPNNDVQEDTTLPPPSTSKRIEIKQISSPKSFQKKKQKEPEKNPPDDDRLNEVYSILKTTLAEGEVKREKHETCVYGDYVAKTLKNLDNHSRIVAKHYINQILFKAEMGKYKEVFSVGVCEAPSDPLSATHSELSQSRWPTPEPQVCKEEIHDIANMLPEM